MSEKDLLLPDIGDFENVEVIELLVAAGDSVKAEDSLLILESDKATMDIPSPYSGTIKKMAVAVGDKISKGSLLGLIDVDGAAAAPPAAARAAEKDNACKRGATGGSRWQCRYRNGSRRTGCGARWIYCCFSCCRPRQKGSADRAL